MNNKASAMSSGTRILVMVLCTLLAAALVCAGLLLSQSNRLHVENGDLSAAMTLAQTDNETLSAALQDTQAEAAQALSALQAEFDAAKAADEEALLALQTEYDTYQTDTGAAMAALQTDYDTLNESYATLQAESDLALANAQDTATANLQAAQDEATAALAALQAEYDTLSDAYATYQADSELALAAAQNTGAANLQAQTEATAALAALQAEYDLYQAEAEAAYAALSAEYETYQKSSTASNQALQAKQTETADELAALQEAYDVYIANADISFAELAALQESHAETEAAYTQLEAEFSIYKGQAELALTSAMLAADSDLAALQAEFDTCKTEAETAYTTLEKTKNDELASSAEALADAQLEIRAAQKELALAYLPKDANGAGNGANGMLAHYSGDSIYYHNNYDNGNIYRMDPSGSFSEYLHKTDSAEPLRSNNILGEFKGYLYYCNNHALCRMNLDTGKANVIDRSLYYYPVSGIQYVDGKLYFLQSTGETDERFCMGVLYCINPNGSKPEEMNIITPSFSSNGEYIYYIQQDGKAICSFNPASGNITVLYSGSGITCLNLVEDTLYFSADGKIQKIGKQGGASASVGNARGTVLNVTGNWIYFANSNNFDKLYRITTDGKYYEMICDKENIEYISIAGEWIYFIQRQELQDVMPLPETFKVRLDGSGLSPAAPR